MKAIVLLFAFVAGGVASAQAKATCKLPLYIEAVHDVSLSTMDSAESMFLYGLKSAVSSHDGCVVDKIADAQLDLYVRTLKLVNDSGRSDSSVVAVALAVPLNGVPVYMDDYVLVIRDTESVDGQVNELLENIGETLDRHSAPAR